MEATTMLNEDSKVRISVRAWRQVMTENRAAHESRDAEVRKAQFDLCRELIEARRDTNDEYGWVGFRKTLTVDDRRRLFLCGFDSLAFLEGEFFGEQADMDRASKKKRLASAKMAEAERKARQEKMASDLQEAIEDQCDHLS
jgi:hypothetical protein